MVICNILDQVDPNATAEEHQVGVKYPKPIDLQLFPIVDKWKQPWLWKTLEQWELRLKDPGPEDPGTTSV